MKRIRSWFIICATTIVSCAIVGFMLIGAWWNSVMLAGMLLIVYEIVKEND